MRRFSSSEVCNARVTWASHVFPTMVTTGAPLASRSASPASSAAATSLRQVDPNAAMRACSSGSSRTRLKNSISLGLERESRPRRSRCPKASSRCTIRSLSSRESEIPSPLLAITQRAVVRVYAHDDPLFLEQENVAPSQAGAVSQREGSRCRRSRGSRKRRVLRYASFRDRREIRRPGPSQRRPVPPFGRTAEP